MSITVRDNGTFLVSIGSREGRVRKVFKTMAEAKAFERNPPLPKTVPVAEKPKKPKHTLADLLKRTRILKWQEDSGKQFDNAKLVVDFLGSNRLVSSIDRSQVNSLIESLYCKGNSSSTINRKLSALSVMLSVAEDEGWIEHHIRIPRQKERQGRKKVITKEEELIIYSVCDRLGMADLKDYIQFTLDTGFRKMESLNILVRDCQDGIATLYDGETKSGKGRKVPLTERAMRIVSARKFKVRLFEGMNEYSLRRDWDKLRDVLGYGEEFVVHTLRHTCATRLGEAGHSAMFIKEWLGHSSVVVSQQYVHLNVDHLKAGVESLKF